MENKEFQQFTEAIKRYLFTAIGYWYIFLLAIILAFILAKYKNRFSYNIYSIYTTIYIEAQQKPELYAGGIPIQYRVNLENEIGVLTSYQMNYKVLKQLPSFYISYFKYNKWAYSPELYKNAPFKVIFDSTAPDPAYGKKIFITILSKSKLAVSLNKKQIGKIISFGETFSKHGIKFKILKSKNFSPKCIGKKYFFVHNNIQDLAHQYSQKLRIDLRSPNSTILWLWMETPTPAKDIDYLNKLAQVYIRQRIKHKNEIAVKTIEFIDKQLKIFSDSLKTTERQLQQAKQNIPVNLTSNGQSLNDQLQKVQLQLKQLQLQKNYYQQLYSTIASSSENKLSISIIPPSVVGIKDDILENYIKQLTDAIYQLTVLKLSVKNTEKIPLTKENELKITQIKIQLLNYIKQSITFLNSSIKNLEQQQQQLINQIRDLPISQQQLMQVNRKFQINNQIYTFLLQRRMEASITLASSRPDAMVIDKAVPETIRFKRKVGYISPLKVVILALIIAVSIIFFIIIMDNKIKNTFDIEQLTHIPILGNIIHNDLDSKLPLLTHPQAPISETFRSLKTNILYYTLPQKIKTPTIILSSTISGEGKSFIASNLAVAFALANKKTVILEADLRKPKIYHYLNFKTSDIGISTYLLGEHNIEQIIFPTQIQNLFLIPSGEIPPNPVELLESPKMEQLLQFVKQNFDVVIIDTPPIGIVTDALVLANHATLFIFAIRQLYSTKSSVKILNDLSKKHLKSQIGIVFNDIKTDLTSSLKYGYHYTYSYKYKYSYYSEKPHKHRKIRKLLQLLLPNKHRK